MNRKSFVLVIGALLSIVCFSISAQPALPKANSTQPSGQLPKKPEKVPEFQFKVRTAFMLTPAQVAAIQSVAIGDSNSKEAQKISSDPSLIPAWGIPVVRTVSLAAPLGIKIQSENLIALIAIMPVELDKNELTLLVQNQIFAQSQDKSVQLNTSVHTIKVPLNSFSIIIP